jgi:TP901 family phage tail tape measure protein
MSNTEKIIVQVQVKGQRELDNLSKTTKKASKDAGNLTKSFAKMSAGVLGAVVAFRQINQIVGNALRSFRDFEFQMAKVRAVTSASDKDFKLLSNTAKDLGRSTFFTAQQVSELQTNFGKLGFSTQEILDAQEATLLLATATDTDLARAATVAGASVRGFGLDAEETGRIVDVMAVAFRSSALDIEKFQTSMTKVAPIAAGAGISMESTTAVMASLTDAGIEASIAGTSLRNIFLKMQDSSSDLSKHLGFTVNSSDDLQRALTLLNSQALDNEEIMGLVDIRQVAAFRTMVEGSDRIQNLTRDFNAASGEARRMANIVGDTLEGSFKRLRSATEGLAIELTQKLGGGLQDLVDKLADFFNRLTDNSDALVKLIRNIVQVIKFLGIYAAGLAAVRVATLAYNAATFLATNATKLFTKALARTGIGLAVIALGSLIAKFTGLGEETDEATKKLKEFEEQQAKILKRNERFDRLINQQVGNSISQARKIIKNLEFEKAKRESVLIAAKNGVTELNDEQKKLFENEIRRLKERIRLEKINGQELVKNKKQETTAARSLIVEQEKLLDLANRMPETTESEIAVKNKKIQSIEAEIDRLKNLGIEVEKVNKAKRAELDIDRELLDFQLNEMIQGNLSEQQAAEVRRELIQQEINDSKMLLEQLVISGEQREFLMAKIVQLEKELGQQSSEDKKARLEEDIVTAALSGQNALDSVKSVIRAHIMASISGHIRSIMTNPLIPFPINLALAAGAGMAVGSLVDKGLSSIKFANGGTVEEFANGGMVHGKSHAFGGEKFAVGGRVVELEGGEAVINKRSTAMFRGQLSAMNSAGGGVKFADGGLLNMPSFTQQQFNAVGQNKMMGAVSQGSKVVVVESDITQAQQSVSVIESQVTF